MAKSKIKFITALIIAVISCLILTYTASAAQIGDVDANGEINAADARLALRVSVNLDKLTAEEFTAADIDCSGDIKAADARSILRAAVGLEELTRNHKFSEWKIEKKATCTVDGLQSRKCPCGTEQTKTIPTTGEHTFGKWTVTKKATCTANGIKIRKCECGETQTKKIPAAHTFNIEKATVTQSKVCTRCKYTEAKSFNEYVNSIKTQPHILSYLDKTKNTSKVTKDTLKIDRAQLFLLLTTMGGYTAKEANKEINAMENELKNGMNYTQLENTTFYKNRTLTENNYPIEGSALVSELEDNDVASYTVEKVAAVDFREFLDETYTATNTGYEYDTSNYRYLKADNLIKLTVVLNTEKYSEIKNSDKKTALMKATDIDIRELAGEVLEFSAGEDMEGFATAECKEITSNETIIVYIDAENNAPVASCYISSIICEPTITMDLMGMIEGSIDFTTDSEVVSLYFFDDYFA